MFSFYTDDSYEPIINGPDPANVKKKPQIVPSLNLNNLPEYESSSEEGDGEQDKAEEGRVMNAQDYEQSMKYIENFYNKCAKDDDFVMC